MRFVVYFRSSFTYSVEHRSLTVAARLQSRARQQAVLTGELSERSGAGAHACSEPPGSAPRGGTGASRADLGSAPQSLGFEHFEHSVTLSMLRDQA
jgi:hypothetical protein